LFRDEYFGKYRTITFDKYGRIYVFTSGANPVFEYGGDIVVDPYSNQ